MADSDPNKRPDERSRDFGERLTDHIHDEINARLDERMRRRREKMERRFDRMERRRNRSPFGGLLLGTILAGVGVLLLLDNLGIHIVDEIWEWWPVILIGVGAARVLTACSWGGKVWGSALIFIGGVFLLHNLGYLRGDPWSFFWPVILIAVGIAMLARGLDRGGFWWPGPSNPGAGPASPSGGSAASGLSGSAAADTLSEWAVFGGSRRRVDTQNFQGGEALAIFGGINVDLTRAGSTLEEVRVEANALFGGIDIRVPDTWQVVVRGVGIFGAYEDKTWRTTSEERKPRLVVAGFAMFGGVVVKS